MPCASGTAPGGALPERFKIPYSDGLSLSLSLSLSLCVCVGVFGVCVALVCEKCRTASEVPLTKPRMPVQALLSRPTDADCITICREARTRRIRC